MLKYLTCATVPVLALALVLVQWLDIQPGTHVCTSARLGLRGWAEGSTVC